MTIYTAGNAAKQWILSELHERFGDSVFRVLDLGCGTASSWVKFLEMHPRAQYIGYDYNKVAIAKGRKDLVSLSNVTLHDGDAQLLVMDSDYDVVTAFSAIEHVVDRLAFLKTVHASLKSGGIAFLNYDDGHFRSRNIKERIMVPISQLLAVFGFQGPYMKHVNDAEFLSQAKSLGFEVLMLRKHNLYPMKGFMKGAGHEAVVAWYEFEERLNVLYPPEVLDRIKWSTTLVLEKP